MPLSSVQERLRARGLRMTPQRRAIADAFDSADSAARVHPSAEDVLAHARRLVPETSRATVYNTLRELVAEGDLLELAFEGGAARYDPNVDDGHHHFVCEHCGRMEDVHPRGVDGVRLDSGHRISRVDVVFRGTCPDCL